MSDARRQHALHYQQGFRFVAVTADAFVYARSREAALRDAPGAEILALQADGTTTGGKPPAGKRSEQHLQQAIVVPPHQAVVPNPVRLPKGFEGWQLQSIVAGVDRKTGKSAPIYWVRSPRGADGLLVPHGGKYAFHEQLDLFPGSRAATPGQGALFAENPNWEAVKTHATRAAKSAAKTAWSAARVAGAGAVGAIKGGAVGASRKVVELHGKDAATQLSDAELEQILAARKAAAAGAGAEKNPKWSKKYKDMLPDRAFAFVDPDLPKSEGRHLPLFNLQGQPSVTHIRNALPRLSQTRLPSEAVRRTLRTRIEQLLARVDAGAPVTIADWQPVYGGRRNPGGHGELLTGQVHADAQGRPVVTTFEKRGKKRVKVDIVVPAVPDWRRDLARPPRRLAQPMACGTTPLTTGCHQEMPIGTAWTAGGVPIEYGWQIVDLADLKVSHDPWTLQPRADYPQELQPRDRARKSYDDQLRRLVQAFEPLLLTWSATVSDGAPIVGPDGVVESGNGRTMALSRIYRDHPDKAAAYKKTIKKWADYLGARWHRVDRPVLVRVRQTHLDRAEFARAANIAGQQGMAAAEQALTDAAAMPLDIMGLYEPDHGLGTRENQLFVQAFLKNVAGPAAVGQFTTEGGKLSKAGESRIELALFAKAWGLESAPLLAAWGEDPDSDLRVVIGAMADAAPRWLKLAWAVADGLYAPRYLIASSVVEAAIVYRAAKAKSMHVLDFLRQIDLVQQPSQLAELWIEAAHPSGRRASRKGLSAALQTYVDLVEEQGPLNQVGMFGPVETAPIDIVRRAIRLAKAAA